MDVYHRYVEESETPAIRLRKMGFKNPDVVTHEIQRLFERYGSQVSYGKLHPAPCSAWRSERILLDDETLPRFAVRVHLFEKSKRQNSTNMSGRYLGYVSLRPVPETKKRDYFQYVAVANITVPRYMLRPRFHVLSCVGGAADGVLPFRCVPFCFPYDKLGRASCLATALHDAMLLKTNTWGYTPLSSQDIITRLWEINHEKPDSNERRSLQAIAEDGASLAEALEVLTYQQPDADPSAGGILETFSIRDFLQGRDYSTLLEPEKRSVRDQVSQEVHRCLTDYLANGIPIIVELFQKEAPGHAVLVLGMHLLHDSEEVETLSTSSEPDASQGDVPGHRRVDRAELPGRFIYHDIDEGPFTEKTAEALFRLMWKEDSQDPLRSGISLLVIAPKFTEIGIYHVRQHAKKWTEVAIREQYDWVQFLNTRSTEPIRHPNDLRFVTRLLQTGQLKRRYFEDFPDDREWQQLLSVSASSSFWWAVEIRLPFSVMAAHEAMSPPRHEVPPGPVYLWAASDLPETAPRAILRPDAAGVKRLICREE